MSERLSDPTGLANAPPAPPSTLVIFGGAGDLTKRLLMPALYNLSLAKLLDPAFSVIGVDRIEMENEAFRTRQTESMQSFVTDKGGEFSADKLDDNAWGWLRGRLGYLAGDFDDPATFQRLKDRLAQTGTADGHQNCVFYLAVAARFFGPVADRLAEAGLMAEENRFRRLVVEKPFGDDLASARALNARLLAAMGEDQIFRIDHFLGKETVQNIMALRFANGIFEPLWNRDHIDHVQITAAETVGVEQRGKFYEPTGALRDMVPNHMMQLLAMTAMEPPNSFDADAVRAEKAKVVEAIRSMTDEQVMRDVVRGQYAPGALDGRPLPGYVEEPNVATDSHTETYIAAKLQIDNWRWAGVPFYVRTGKRLTLRRTEVAIQFKQAPFALFRDTPVEKLTPNFLLLHIQPSEGVTLNFSAKIPGPSVKLEGVGMDFRYSDHFSTGPSTGYETLIYDVLIGDATLFQRADNIEAGWQAVQPMLDGWHRGIGDVQHYPVGSAGPGAADALLARDGRRWLALA